MRRNAVAAQHWTPRPAVRSGIRGRDQSHPRPTFFVVRTDNEPRTQNGHIRNDTHDVSRRISGPSNGPICRRMCVASDRACTRVTLRNLHGKEGVDGSSPSEGFDKVPANWHFVVVCPLNTRTHSGHTFGTGDAPRRLATPHG